MQQIAEWLEKLGMSEYAQRFAENGIDVSVLRYLTDQDLESGTSNWNEFPPSHSITSSARSRIVVGIVSPSVLAVLRLMSNSNLVGCTTGRSAGFAPFTILST
jgi:SAM domain (Sterile alpha motif)